jgi:hypothetical protein
MTSGLSLEQSPPLSVPLLFFFTAPLALVAAGLLLTTQGWPMLASRSLPGTAAATHLGTLGFLTMVMFGALYQMIPVVAGVPVPAIRLGHLVHVFFTVGLGLLFQGVTKVRPALLWMAWGALLVATLLFVIPAALALARAPTRTDTVHGMRLSLLGLMAAAGLGLWLVASYALDSGSSARVWLMPIHVTFGLVLWVGGLLVSVSWTILPMFYLVPGLYPEVTRRTLWALALTGITVPVMIGFDLPGWELAAAPGVVAIWFVHPLAAFIVLAQRKRGRPDPSLWFWRAGLVLAPLVLIAAIAAVWFSDPRLPVLFGWLAIWGWAGILVHGMLTRILPFLVWFHRFAALAGRVAIPPMRRLLPDALAQTGLFLHLATVALGVLAILTRADWLARATGAGLAGTGLVLAASLASPLRHPVPRVPDEESSGSPPAP